MEFLKINLFRAYYEARKNKRNTINQLAFEIDYEQELWKLYDDIVNKTYEVGRSIVFIVNRPVKREVFAASFRDRVVHHLVCFYIVPIIETHLIKDAYSCRVGKGTSFGIKQAKKYMQEVTENYTQQAFVMKLDVQGYFMSINKDILWRKIKKMVTPEAFIDMQNLNTGGNPSVDIDYETLMYLIKKIVYNDPTQNCIVKSSKREWNGLPASKSLFKTQANIGLPIGNLTSQLFSNIYLADFDSYIKQTLELRYYGRYVDDFYIMHRDKKVLIKVKRKCEKYLRELKLKLHPNKVYLQTCRKGFCFLGVYIKPYRIYISRRTKTNFKNLMYNIKEQDMIYNKDNIRSRVNSYLGILSHYQTYRLKFSVLRNVYNFQWFQYGKFDERITKFMFYPSQPITWGRKHNHLTS